MTKNIGTEVRKARTLLVLAAALSLSTGCDGILDVDERSIISTEDLDRAGPAAVPTLLNGMVGTYHGAVDGIIRYSALLTDEMILAGTFPTRLQVDNRRILDDNLNVTGMYTALHQARLQADTLVFLFENRIDDPAYSDVTDELRLGLMLGKLYGGYTRLSLAELFCWSILTGMYPEDAPVLPDDRVQDALAFLERAESDAASMGVEAVRLAAIVGQARAYLWLGNHDLAADLASEVPRAFTYWAEHSNGNPSLYNGMYVFTWGDTQAIRWTVGDGTRPDRGSERWEYLDEFLQLNLLRDRPPGFQSFQGSIPVVLQLLYNRPEQDVLVASGIEARLIEAEAAIRNDETETAEGILNDLRSDYSVRANFLWGVPFPAPGNQLEDLVLAADLEADIGTLAGERARELWLTGDRLTTSRRLRLDSTVDVDLFPPVKTALDGGDDIAFPMVRRELDHNPNLGSGDACPEGQAPGSWR